MAYNKARAEKEWLKWKEAEEKKLRELGVDEDTIQRLHTNAAGCEERMSRPLFMFRPNLRNAEHRKAWEVLRNVPEGQKSAFLVHAILETVQKEDLEAILRRVLREELKAVPPQPMLQQEETIPKEMMGFLGSLMDED